MKLRKLLLNSWIVFFLLSCSTIAQWAAPEKAKKKSHMEAYNNAEKKFWNAFHNGEYGKIPELLEVYKAIYVENPGHYQSAARIGFIHTWALSERRRLKSIPPSITDHATLCQKYFKEAYSMKDDPRYLGFWSSCILAEAEIHGNERDLRKGYFLMKDAIAAWPEFNNFTGGYVLSNQEYDSDLISTAADWLWSNLDACTDEKVDRDNPNYAKYMTKETLKGSKRVCWNSNKAPHNFEGFFLNMGDLLVKQGYPKKAKIIYANAKLSNTYQSWAYAGVLEERIRNAEQNVKEFRKVVSAGSLPSHPISMFNSAYSCMACHQN